LFLNTNYIYPTPPGGYQNLFSTSCIIFISVLAKSKRRGILQKANLSRQQDLTPRCKKFYKLIGEWGRRTATLQHSIRSLRCRLRNAKKVATCSSFNTLMDSANETTYNFILQQVRTQKQNPYARRFTLNDKLLKQIPRDIGYCHPFFRSPQGGHYLFC
jgi:hypothetical protein